MAKKITSNDLFDANLFTKTKDDALVYLSVLKDIEKEFRELVAVQGQIVKTSNKNDVSGLQKRESAIKQITAAEKELLKVEKQIVVTEAKLEISEKQQVEQLAKLRAELNRKNKAQRDSIKAANDESNAYKKLTNRVNSAQAQFKRLAAQFGINSKQAKQARIALDGVQKEMMQIDAAARDGRRNVGRYGTAFKGLGNGLKSIGGRFLAVTALIYGLGRAIVSSFKTFRDFQQGSANLAAVLGKTRGEIRPLLDDAKRLGATTAFTASEVTKLQVSFSKLGFNEDEILNATEATLALAAATGSDLDESATVAAQTLNGFGLDASETKRVVDVMAKSFTTSALDMSKFSAAMANVAPVAKIAGFSIERTTAILGTLVDNGLDASKAGTDLRNIFQNLAKSGLTMEQAMDKIRSSTDKISTATDLFGKRSAAAGIIIADNNKHLIEMEKGLNNAGGAAQEMADTQLDTLSGSVTKLSSAWEGFILSLEDGDGTLSTILKGAIDLTTDLVNVFTKLASSQEQWDEKVRATQKKAGIGITTEDVSKFKEFQDLSNDALEKVKENEREAKLILSLRKAGIKDLIEQQLIYNVTSVRSFTEDKEKQKQQTDFFGNITDEALGNIEAFDGMIETNKQEIQRLLSQMSDDEIILFSEKNILNANSYTKTVKSVLATELQRRKDIKETIVDINDESESGGKRSKKRQDKENERLKALNELEKERNKIWAERAKINADLADAEIESELSTLQNQIDKELERQLKLADESTADVNVDELERLMNEKFDIQIRQIEFERNFKLTKLQEESEEFKNKTLENTQLTEDEKSSIIVEHDELMNDKRRLIALETQSDLDEIEKSRIKSIDETNDEIIEAQIKAADEEKKRREKEQKDKEKADEDAKKKEMDLFNQRLQAAQDFANALVEISNKRIDKQLENIDKEIEASKERQSQLESIANQGQLTAQQSVKAEIRQQDELENQKAALEERKQRREALASGFNLLAANLEKGASGDAAVSQTFRQMTNLISLISNLPGFYKGTDDAPEGLAWTDEKGAEIHMDKDGNIKDFGTDKGAQLKYLAKGDKILTAGESNIVKRQLNMQPALEQKEMKSAQMLNDARIVQAVQSVVQAVNEKPVQSFEYDEIQKAVIDKMKGGNQLMKKHISNKPKF